MEPTSATTGPAARTPSGRSEKPPASGASALSSDFETFLKMLTVQMENQDPLNPIQSADFAVQLATFSGVEQQVRTNDLLQSLVADRALGGLATVAGWVGQQARAPVAVDHDGTPVDLYFDVPAAADQATLTVRDATGSAVTRIAISPDDATHTWDGTDASGAAVPPGQYSFTIEARSKGKLLDSVVPEIYATVLEARLEDGSPVLVLGGDEVIPVADVTGIRTPVAR